MPLDNLVDVHFERHWGNEARLIATVMDEGNGILTYKEKIGSFESKDVKLFMGPMHEMPDEGAYVHSRVIDGYQVNSEHLAEFGDGKKGLVQHIQKKEKMNPYVLDETRRFIIAEGNCPVPGEGRYREVKIEDQPRTAGVVKTNHFYYPEELDMIKGYEFFGERHNAVIRGSHIVPIMYVKGYKPQTNS